MEASDLTTEEAAARLGLKAARIRQLCRSGELPAARRWGRDWVVPATAVEHYQQARKPAHRPRKEAGSGD